MQHIENITYYCIYHGKVLGVIYVPSDHMYPAAQAIHERDRLYPRATLAVTVHEGD